MTHEAWTSSLQSSLSLLITLALCWDGHPFSFFISAQCFLGASSSSSSLTCYRNIGQWDNPDKFLHRYKPGHHYGKWQWFDSRKQQRYHVLVSLNGHFHYRNFHFRQKLSVEINLIVFYEQYLSLKRLLDGMNLIMLLLALSIELYFDINITASMIAMKWELIILDLIIKSCIVSV